MKPNNELLSVNVKSDHPPLILKNIPEGINARLSSISSSKEIFDKAKGPYEDSLRRSGYTYNMNYNPQDETSKKKRRSRHILWFNPPYTRRLNMDFGRQFLRLLDDCFPPDHQLRPIFNRQTVKLSYSCMPSLAVQIARANKAKINPPQQPQNLACNCRNVCQVPGQCRLSSVIYKATVTANNSQIETYTGLTPGGIRERISRHYLSFNNRAYSNKTELSKHIWNLKDKGDDYTMQWEVTSKVQSYHPTSKICNLCIREIYIILFKSESASLNKRNEIMNKCRHRARWKIINN